MVEPAHILILERSDCQREALSEWVGARGRTMDACDSLDGAAEAIQNRLPDLVITCLGPWGSRVPIEALRGMVGAATPILLTSGAVDLCEGELEGLPVEGMLAKPFTFYELDARIQTLLLEHRHIPAPSLPRRDLVGPELQNLRLRLGTLESPVVVVEARWDGDTQNGWFVDLGVIVVRPSYEHGRYSRHILATYTFSRAEEFYTDWSPHEIRGAVAQKFGGWLAWKLDVPFRFESPTVPTDDPVAWWDTQPDAGLDEWTVAWRLGKVTDDGSYEEESGEVLERASSPRAAHQAAIDRLLEPYKPLTLADLGIVEMEAAFLLLGLEDGPVHYVLHMTPTRVQVSEGPPRLLGVAAGDGG